MSVSHDQGAGFRPVQRTLRLVLMAALILGLAACVPRGSWHQTMRLYLQTPEGPMVAEATVKMTFADATRARWALPNARNLKTDLTGEAVVADLGQGRYLFALLGGETQRLLRTYDPVRQALRERRSDPSFKQVIKAFKRDGVERDVPAHELPLLVSFTDITDPASVVEVDPKDLAASFGAGYALERITLEVTREAVTEGGVEGVLGWLGNHRGKIKKTGKKFASDVLPEERLYVSDFIKGKSQ